MAIEGTRPYKGTNDVDNISEFLKEWDDSQLQALCEQLDIPYDNLPSDGKAFWIVCRAIGRGKSIMLFRVIQ